MLMCRGLAVIASDYVDGELSASARFSVRMHLLMCRHCRAFVSSLRKSAALIESHLAVHADPRFIERINAEITRVLADRATGEPPG